MEEQEADMKDDKLNYRLRRKIQSIAYDITSPEFVSKLYFYILLKKRLNLQNPTTFNEKLQWLKLYYCPKDPLVISCSDKWAVREYIEKKGYGMYLNELYFTWNDAYEIEWEKLPKQFVLKCNHGCGYNIVCDDKSKLSVEYAIKKINRWMGEDFGKFNAEPHYDKISKKIICEKYLGGDIIDYKFFCFNGKPQFMYIAQGFGKGNNERITFFDMNGNKAPYRRKDYNIMDDAVLPVRFEEMSTLSKELSADFPFVRVDLFEVNGKIYFSELTFTPCGGLMEIEPLQYDSLWGSYIDIGQTNNFLKAHQY